MARRAVAFDLAIAGLRLAQRRVLRLLLTGASLELVAQAAAVDRYHIVHWLGDGTTYRPAVDALQNDLGPAMRGRLHALIVSELAARDDDGLEAAAWATLAVIRAIGRLDTETNLLHHSSLRAERWSTARP
jgi:hypothetical protein